MMTDDVDKRANDTKKYLTQNQIWRLQKVSGEYIKYQDHTKRLEVHEGRCTVYPKIQE